MEKRGQITFFYRKFVVSQYRKTSYKKRFVFQNNSGIEN